MSHKIALTLKAYTLWYKLRTTEKEIPGVWTVEVKINYKQMENMLNEMKWKIKKG